MHLKCSVLLVLLAKGMLIYRVEGAPLIGAEGLGSSPMQGDNFYLLFQVKTGTYVPKTAKGYKIRIHLWTDDR